MTDNKSDNKVIALIVQMAIFFYIMFFLNMYVTITLDPMNSRFDKEIPVRVEYGIATKLSYLAPYIMGSICIGMENMLGVFLFECYNLVFAFFVPLFSAYLTDKILPFLTLVSFISSYYYLQALYEDQIGNRRHTVYGPTKNSVVYNVFKRKYNIPI